MKIGICDDNHELVEKTASRITDIMNAKNVVFQLQKFYSGEELLFKTEGQPIFADVLFMDIILNGLNGLETCRELRKRGFHGIIVFLSTSKNYAVDAFEVGAISYIMKDELDTVKFEEIVEKAIDITNHDATHKMLIVNNKSVFTIDLRKVIYFESNMKKVIAHEATQSYAFYGKFEDVYQSLKDKGFIRSHKSYLINYEFIKSFTPTEICCSANVLIPMGRTYYKAFRERFMLYLKDAVQL